MNLLPSNLKQKRLSAASPQMFKVDAATGEISGYASVFNEKDSYGDMVVPGAFAESIKKRPAVVMLWQHQRAEPIGTFYSLKEDQHGLFVKGRILLGAGEIERRVHAHLSAGSISGLSIGFNLPAGGSQWDSARGVNLLKKIDLWEVSVVTWPALDSARVQTVKAGPPPVANFLRWQNERVNSLERRFRDLMAATAPR